MNSTDKQLRLIDKYIRRLLELYKLEYEAALGEIKGLVLDVYAQITVEDKPLLSHLYQFRRYYKLTNDIQKVLTQLGVKQEKLFSKELENYFKANVALLDDQFEVDFETKQKEIQTALNYIYEDSQWSESIWKDKSLLLNRIRHQLVMNVATGKSIDKMADDLKAENLTDNFTNRKRLVRTEVVKYYSKTTIDRYRDAGVERVKYNCLNDNRSCESCKANNGKTFTLKQSEGMIPRHPNCRCYWTPVI